MSEAPKRMWVHEGFWTSGDAGYWTKDEQESENETQYIREDLVLELVEALKAWINSINIEDEEKAMNKAIAALAKLEKEG